MREDRSALHRRSSERGLICHLNAILRKTSCMWIIPTFDPVFLPMVAGHVSDGASCFPPGPARYSSPRAVALPHVSREASCASLERCANDGRLYKAYSMAASPKAFTVREICTF